MDWHSSWLALSQPARWKLQAASPITAFSIYFFVFFRSRAGSPTFQILFASRGDWPSQFSPLRKTKRRDGIFLKENLWISQASERPREDESFPSHPKKQDPFPLPTQSFHVNLRQPITRTAVPLRRWTWRRLSLMGFEVWQIRKKRGCQEKGEGDAFEVFLTGESKARKDGRMKRPRSTCRGWVLPAQNPSWEKPFKSGRQKENKMWFDSREFLPLFFFSLEMAVQFVLK